MGWWSDWASQSQCEALLAELRANQKSGQGPQTLKGMREINKERGRPRPRPMIEAGKSPSHIRHGLIAVSVVWNLAAEVGVVSV